MLVFLFIFHWFDAITAKLESDPIALIVPVVLKIKSDGKVFYVSIFKSAREENKNVLCEI